MEFINLTPHAINLNDGTVFPPSGDVARVTVEFSVAVDGTPTIGFGSVEGLPDLKPSTRYIVSAMVAGATNRLDALCPATGHSDTVRNDKGHIVSVPFLARMV